MIGQRVIVTGGVYRGHKLEFRRGVIIAERDGSEPSPFNVTGTPHSVTVRMERRGRERNFPERDFWLTWLHLDTPELRARIESLAPGAIWGHEDAEL